MYSFWRWIKTKQLIICVVVGFIVLHPIVWKNSKSADSRSTRYLGFFSFLLKNGLNFDDEDIAFSLMDNETPYDNISFLITDEKVGEVVTPIVQNNLTVSVQISDYYTKSRQLPITLFNDYLINNIDICSGSLVTNVLVMVHSSIPNYNRRNTIRETYGSKTLFLPYKIRVVFLVGRPSDRNVQAAVEDESMKHKDIVQGDFIDSYHNLTHKAVMGLRWVTEFCHNSEWVLRVDDDVIFDMQLFLELFASRLNPNTLHCHAVNYPIIFRAGKWKIAQNEFQGRRRYPWAYCPGFAALFRSEIAIRLYKAAFVSPFFWIDDIYVYGILRHQAKIKLEDFKESFIKIDNYDYLKNCIVKNLLECNILAMCIPDKFVKKAYHLFTTRRLARKSLTLGQH